MYFFGNRFASPNITLKRILCISMLITNVILKFFYCNINVRDNYKTQQS